MKPIAALAAVATLWQFSTPAHADSEAALWLEAGVGIELHDRLELELGQHLRFDQDISRVSAVMPEAGLELEVTKYFELGTGYRYEYERQGMDLEGGHRVHVDAGVETKLLRPLELGYRVRLQDRVGESGKVRWRNRVQMELDSFKTWKPAASVELFHSIADGPIEYRKARYTLGVEFERWEQDVQVFYRVDASSDMDDPTMHIVGLEIGAKL
jgi:hypothetical protein